MPDPKLDNELLNAVKDGDFAGVKTAVANGADVNSQDSNFAPALMWAAFNGDLNLVKYLISEGANPFTKGCIYLDSSRAYYGNLLSVVAGQGDIHALVYFLDSLKIPVDDKEFNLSTNATDGWTALQWAASKGHIQACRVLLSRGANIDIHDSVHATPLLYALQNGHHETGYFLMNNAADVSIRNNMGWRAMHLAARNGASGLLEMILEVDKRINEQGYDGFTPLMLAALNDQLESCFLLLEYGASLKTKNQNNETAIDLAIQRKHDRVISYFNDPSSYKTVMHLLSWLEVNQKVEFYNNIGKHIDAVELTEIYFKAASRDFYMVDSVYGISIYQIAFAHEALGSFQSALTMYNKVLPYIEKSLGETSNTYAVFLTKIGRVLYKMGRLTEALNSLYSSFRIYEQGKNQNNEDYATLLLYIGDTHAQLKEYMISNYCYFRVLEFTSRNPGKFTLLQGLALRSFADMSIALELPSVAIPFYTQALNEFGIETGKYSIEYATTLTRLADVYFETSEFQSAFELYNEAKSIFNEIGAVACLEYSSTLFGLSKLYELIPDFNSALANYKSALEIIEVKVGKQNDAYSKTLNNLGQLYDVLGQSDSASSCYLEANKLSISILLRKFTDLAEKEKFCHLYSKLSSFYKYQSHSLGAKSSKNQWSSAFFNNELILKGIVLESRLNTGELVTSSHEYGMTDVVDIWRSTINKISKQSSIKSNRQSDNMDSLTLRAKMFDRAISMLSSNSDIERLKKDITWEQVQSQLQSNEVTIEFSHFRYYNKKWTDSTLYVAYLLRKDSEHPEMIYLFEEKQLELLAKGTATDALYTRSGGFKAVNQSLHNKGKDLYDLIWKNLEPHLEGIETIYFAPSGKLHQIAFAALADSTEQLLSEKYKLVQMSSTGKLVVPDPEPEKAPALVMGGIQYEYDTTSGTSSDSFVQVYNPVNLVYQGNDATNRSSRGETWQYLNGTRKEARSIYRLYKGHKEAITLVSESDATEAYVKSLDGNSPKVLHLATHGFFFEDPEDKYQEMTFMGNQPVYTLADDPLMRSGLVMAGANYAWQHGQNPYEEEDGILTAYEISNLNLSNTDLVVLSACETGLGDIEGSEGVYGLQRAFRMAGVEYIIMSLWEVPDKETSEFMKLFYKTWLGGDQGIYKAFTHTQRTMAAKYRDEPQKWAGFVLVQ